MKIVHLIFKHPNRVLKFMNKIAHICNKSLMTKIPSCHNIKASCFPYSRNYILVKTANCFIVNMLNCLALALQVDPWRLLAREILIPTGRFCFVIRSLLLFWVINKLNHLCCRLKICASTALWMISLDPRYLSRLILFYCLNRLCYSAVPIKLFTTTSLCVSSKTYGLLMLMMLQLRHTFLFPCPSTAQFYRGTCWRFSPRCESARPG